MLNVELAQTHSFWNAVFVSNEFKIKNSKFKIALLHPSRFLGKYSKTDYHLVRKRIKRSLIVI